MLPSPLDSVYDEQHEKEAPLLVLRALHRLAS